MKPTLLACKAILYPKGLLFVALTSKTKEAQFACIHHGEKPRNTHGLEKHVVKDEEGNILTRRKKKGKHHLQRLGLYLEDILVGSIYG